MTTLSQLKELSNEELRCRVAEELGWIYPGSTCLKHEQWDRWVPPKGATTRRVPNYTDSLDAIAGAEKTLLENWHEPGSLWKQYQHALIRIMNLDDSELPVEAADARQRAIAFLAVRGSLG